MSSFKKVIVEKDGVPYLCSFERVGRSFVLRCGKCQRGIVTPAIGDACEVCGAGVSLLVLEDGAVQRAGEPEPTGESPAVEPPGGAASVPAEVHQMRFDEGSALTLARLALTGFVALNNLHLLGDASKDALIARRALLFQFATMRDEIPFRDACTVLDGLKATQPPSGELEMQIARLRRQDGWRGQAT